MYPHGGEGLVVGELAGESAETGGRIMEAFILMQLLSMCRKKVTRHRSRKETCIFSTYNLSGAL